MMKRIAAVVMTVSLLLSTALAHGVDMSVLLEGLEVNERLDLNGVDTIYRSASQPWIYETETGKLRVYLDYVDAVNDDMLFLRMTLTFAAYEQLTTPHVTFTVNGEAWIPTMIVHAEEYDGTYYHDYMLCFTDETAPLLKAIIRAGGLATVDVGGLEPFHAEMMLPVEEMADLYDRYVNAGGMKQHFQIYHSVWPLMEGGANRK